MQLIALLALLPVAFAAGGPQSPPPSSATGSLTPVPTVATIITINGTYTSNAPLPPATTPLTYPLLNTSAISTSTNNLSSTTKKPTSSVVLVTTSLPGGQQSTITSFVGAPGDSTPTGGAGGATPSGGTQPGSAGRIGEGKAIAALVAFGGAVAMLL